MSTENLVVPALPLQHGAMHSYRLGAGGAEPVSFSTGQSVLHYDELLTNYAQNWVPPPERQGENINRWYLANRLFGRVSVNRASNVYSRMNQSTWYQTTDARVGTTSHVDEVQPYWDPRGSYAVTPFALEGVIDYWEQRQADSAILYEQRQTDVPLVVLQNSLELLAVRDTVRRVANLGSSYDAISGADLWDSYATSDPFLQLYDRLQRIMDETGYKANFLAMDMYTWRVFKLHPKVREALAVHTSTAGSSQPMQELGISDLQYKLRDVLAPNSVHITQARYVDGRSPEAATKKSYIGPDVIMAYCDEASVDSWGACKRFQMTGTPGGAIDGEFPEAAELTVFTYEDKKRGPDGSTIVRVRSDVQYKVERTDSIWVLKDVVDTSDPAYRSRLDSVT